MIRSIAFAILLISAFSLKADFRPLSLHEMIIKSEKIVYGEIVNLGSTHFEIRIEGSLTGDSGILRIRKFEDWTCAWRWTEYKNGQNLFLFLRSWNSELVSMGAGNEGELPMDGTDIYIRGMSLMYVNGDQNDWQNTDVTFPGRKVDVHGGEFYGTKMQLAEFLEAVSYIRKCMNFEYSKYHMITNWKFKCASKEMKDRSKRSLLVNAILREAKGRTNER